MTRISSCVHVKELSDKMLHAEHYEIIRIPNAVKKHIYINNRKIDRSTLPSTFRLGSGHVRFFYDKLKYLRNRYNAIHDELKHRNFDPTYYDEAFEHIPDELYNDWQPDWNHVRPILAERINERLHAILARKKSTNKNEQFLYYRAYVDIDEILLTNDCKYEYKNNIIL